MIDKFLYAFFGYLDDTIAKIEALVITKKKKKNVKR
jgi:hypothetical protein